MQCWKTMTVGVLWACAFAWTLQSSHADQPKATHLKIRQIPPPKSPAESLRAMKVRPGFQIELVAAEPLVMDPVAFDWGNDGRLWVVEMADYPLGIDGKGTPGGRIRVLQDTTGDGRYDKSTIFLDGIAFPSDVMVWRRGVLVTAAPDVFYAEDTSGDGRADLRKVLYTGFGEGNQQHRVNGLRWGLDNWIYLANGDSGGRITSLKSRKTMSISGRDLRIRPDDGSLDPQTGQSQYGRTRDDWGNWFGCNNSAPIFHFLLADHQIRRNPFAAPPGGRITIASVSNTGIYPLSQVISHWEGYRPPPPGEAALFTSACSTSVYRDDRFGSNFSGNTFTSEPVHNLIHRRVLTPKGLTFTSRRATDEQRSEFLASTDSWFRPATVRAGPDGALWVADMYRIVIEHPEWIDNEEEKRIDLRAGHTQGRIYRIVPKGDGHKTNRSLPRFDRMNTEQLVRTLQHPSGWQRDRAQQILVWRGGTTAVSLLEQLSRQSTRAVGRLHGLCTLDGLGQLSDAVLTERLGDSHPGVRRHAVRLTGTRKQLPEPMVRKLLKSTTDVDLHVRLESAYALGEWHDPRAGRALGQMLMANASNPYLTAAAISSINRTNVDDTLTIVLTAPKNATGSHQFVEQLLGIATALGDEQALTRALATITTPRGDRFKPWQFAALSGVFDALAAKKHSLANLIKGPDLLSAVDHMLDHARRMIADEQTDIQQRQVMIRLLGRGRSRRVEDIAQLGTLLDPVEPLDIQLAVIESLAKLDAPQVAKTMVAGWSSHGPAVRNRIIAALSSRISWQRQLLDFIAAGKIRPNDLSASHKQTLLSHRNDDLRRKAKRVLATTVNSDRAAVLSQYKAAISVVGDPLEGEKRFASKCAACHRIGKVGHAVGPDLAALKDRSAKTLLIAILDPSRAIEDKFKRYTVLTDDGRQFSGMIESESGGSITLLAEEGKRETILRSQIDQLRSSQMSLMPVGIEKELKPGDIADLITYLQTLGPPPKQFDGNRPAMVSISDDGAYRLSAASAAIHGASLVFETKYANLGYWQSASDRAEWTVDVKQGGMFDIMLQYACHDDTQGNKFQLSLGGEQIDGQVRGTGDWDSYRRIKIGSIRLPAGQTRASFQAAGVPSGTLLDLREIRLVPKAGR